MTASDNHQKKRTLLPSCGGGGLLLLLLFSWCFVSQSLSPLSTSSSFFFATAIAIDTSSSSSSSATRSTTTTTTTPSPIIYKSRDYHLLEIVPHSSTSFTQGLTLSTSTTSKILYEGTGLNYQSQILQHDPTQHMKTLESRNVEPGHLFGEGITCYYVDRLITNGGGEEVVVREHRLIQLTWKDGIGMIYRINDDSSSVDTTDSIEEEEGNNNEQKKDSLELIDTFTFNTHTGEGWGITFVPQTKEFYVSDGSEYIFVWDVETLAEKRRMAVTLERGGGDDSDSDSASSSSSSVRLKYVNELEFVDFNTKNKCGGDVKDWEIHDVYLEQCQEGDDHQSRYYFSSFNSGESSAKSGTEECNDSDDNNTGRFTSTMSILANVWYQDVLIRIDPVTAKVTRVYDLSDIYPYDQRKKDGADCLNGISVTGKESSGEEDEGLELWVTGKLWPKMYRIRLID